MSLPGLPPLPKPLSALLLRQQEKDSNPIVASIDSPGTPSSLSAPALPPRSKPERLPFNRLDAQLSILKREMAGLRQLDLTLLCQLWSLQESIAEYKSLMADDYDSPSLDDDAYSVEEMRQSTANLLLSSPTNTGQQYYYTSPTGSNGYHQYDPVPEEPTKPPRRSPEIVSSPSHSRHHHHHHEPLPPPKRANKYRAATKPAPPPRGVYTTRI